MTDNFDNATWLIESMCTHYTTFANHFDRRSEAQKRILRDDFNQANRYAEGVIKNAYKQARIDYAGNIAPPLRSKDRSGVLDVADRILRNMVVAPKTYAKQINCTDPVYIAARSQLKTNQQRMRDIFDSLKIKHGVGGHVLCRMHYVKRELNGELMSEYNRLQAENMNEIHHVLAKFENRSKAAIFRDYGA